MKKLNTLLGATVLASCAMAGPATANTRLIVNCFWPAQHRMCATILPTWLKWIEKATDGRVRGIIPPKSLAAPSEQWNAVERGIADVAVQFSGFSEDRVVGPMVSMNLFTATDNVPAMSQALWETQQKYFPNEFKGVHMLSMWVTPGTPFYSLNDNPIDTIDDLKNRKTWTVPGNIAELLKRIGSGVVAGPAVQANELVTRGVVDGFLGMSPSDVQGFQMAPYIKSMTWTKKGVYGPSFSLFINEETWNKISAEDRQAITGASGLKFALFASELWGRENASAIKQMASHGIPQIRAPAEFESELIKLSRPITQGWIDAANAKGIDGEAALTFYRSRAAELSAQAEGGQVK